MFDLSKWLNKWLQISNLEKFLSIQEELFSIDDRVVDIEKQIADLEKQKIKLIESKPKLQEEMKTLSMQLFDKTQKNSDFVIDSSITNDSNDTTEKITEESSEFKEDTSFNKPKEEENSKKETISLKIPNNFQKNEVKEVKIDYNRDPVFDKLRDKKVLSFVEKNNKKNEENKDDVVSFLLRFNSWDKKEKISNFTKERFVV